MKKSVKLLIFVLPLLLAALFLPVSTPACYANAAEPPTILIIVPNAPDDLDITFGPENKQAHRDDKALESFFSIYAYNITSKDLILTVTTNDSTFSISLDYPQKMHNNIYTLDLEKQELTPGESLTRSITLISLRVLLTLIIEGIVFFLMGYRRKQSWLIFLVANIVTQAALNIWLSASFYPLESYILFPLIFGEFVVLVAEMVIFLKLIREHPRWRTAIYVIIANLLSLIAGGYLLMVLPV